MHVVLNMAVSLDGRVAGPKGAPVRLSGPADDRRVHRLRADSDAILVGVGTVLSDDPRLTARTEPEPAAPPIRVVLDSRGRTPEDARAVDDRAPSLILTHAADGPIGHAAVEPLGTELTPGPVLAALEERGVEQLMIEGGPTVAASFLGSGRVDRFHLYIAPRVLGEGPILGAALEGCQIDLVPRARSPLGEGTLVSYGVPP